MDPKVAQISALLHQAAETHHVVFAITDGTDADWATWYADWLANLSSIGQFSRQPAGPKRVDLCARRPGQGVRTPRILTRSGKTFMQRGSRSNSRTGGSPAADMAGRLAKPSPLE